MGDLAESQRLADLAQVDVQAVSVAHSLADERDGMVAFIAAGRSSSAASASGVAPAQRTRVDGRIWELTDHARALTANRSAGSAEVAAATGRLRELPDIRRAALTGDSDVAATMTAYGRVIDALGGIGAALAGVLPSRMASADAAGLPALSRAVDQASVQRAALVGALTAGGPQTGLVTAARTAAVLQETALADFRAAVSPAAADQYDETVTGSDVAAAERDLARLRDGSSLSHADRERHPASQVQAALSVPVDLMRGVESSLVGAEAARIGSERDADVTVLELLVALAAGCLLLTAGVLIRTARAVRPPAAAGPGVAAEPGAAGAADAPATPAAEAVYVSLTLRTHGLIERQLTQLEQLEAAVHDPDELSRLFTLDHLATRMRRHTENLLALAGAEPPNGGERPEHVPLLEVARAAVSEIERYEQVRIRSLPAARVCGAAADDLGHLLAELLDNAAQFAPTSSQVQLSGRLSDGGELLLFVEDDGVGIPAERLARLNALLAHPALAAPGTAAPGTAADGPAVAGTTAPATTAPGPADPGGTAIGRGRTGLGMYVVARLAERHGIRVRLRDHQDGGVTATAVVPTGLVTPAEPDDLPRTLLPAPPGPLLADGDHQLTTKGLPRRVPEAGQAGQPGRSAGLPSARGVDAEELRRKLGGLQQGLYEGRLDLRQQGQNDNDKQERVRRAEFPEQELASAGVSAGRDRTDTAGAQGACESRVENVEEALG
jgi:signal transduction histidine kinase